MEPSSLLTDYGFVLLFIITGIVLVSVSLTAAWLVHPSRPNPEKLTTYECGEDPIGNAWSQFNIRFYVIALVFILFDVEIIFLFPWAVIFGNETLAAATDGTWGWFCLIEMGVFIGILALGLAYAWAKGFLDWVKPVPKPPRAARSIPAELYQTVNEKYATKK
jgi:NADH-quinone oxidoreductase subunit A